MADINKCTSDASAGTMSITSESEELETSSTSIVKKRKITSGKSFKNSWFEDPMFKIWLLPDKSSNYKARCKVCDVVINAGKSDLQKHAATQKHTKKMRVIRTTTKIEKLFENNIDTLHKNQVKKAEIKLAALFAANNIAFRIIDQLEPILKDIFSDSQIAQHINIKRTKCTEIIKNILCKKETDDLVEHLKKTTFSVLVDESTDLGSQKSLAVLVRFLKNNMVQTRLLELIQLDARHLGATEIYSSFKSCLEKYEIPLQYIIGLACDGASVMVGKNHSFFKLLKNDVPHVILLKCICHTVALVASHACSFLPRSPEEFIRTVYTYTSDSAKRSAQLQEMQNFFNERNHKMLKLATTRWLSRYECVVRVLENWKVLENYFIVAVQEDNLKSAEMVLNELRNIYTKGYLFFLKYVLNMFNKFNALFQSRKPLIHVLYSECMILLKQLCTNFIDEAVVMEQDLLTLNLNNPRHFVSIEKLYLGPECLELTTKLPKDGKQFFLTNCLKFYMEAATDLERRLPEQIFQNMCFLDPEVVFGCGESRNINFNILYDKFRNVVEIDKTEIAIEWPCSYVLFYK